MRRLQEEGCGIMLPEQKLKNENVHWPGVKAEPSPASVRKPGVKTELSMAHRAAPAAAVESSRARQRQRAPPCDGSDLSSPGDPSCGCRTQSSKPTSRSWAIHITAVAHSQACRRR